MPIIRLCKNAQPKMSKHNVDTGRLKYMQMPILRRKTILKNAGPNAGIRNFPFDCNAPDSNDEVETKKIKGISSTSSELATDFCSVVKPGAIKLINGCAYIMPIATTNMHKPSNRINAPVINFDNELVCSCFTMAGTRTVESAPSANILRKELGTLNAVINASESVPIPR